MEKPKRIKNYKYNGLGFPMILSEVEVSTIAGERVPNINMRKLQDVAFESLIHLPIKFTGNHVAFIRHYMQMTQQDFAKALGLEKHTNISRWESKGDNSANLKPVYESALRVIMKNFLGEKSFSVIEFTKFLSSRFKQSKKALSLQIA